MSEIDQRKVDEVADVVKGMSFDAFSFKVEEVGVFPNLGRPATIWAGITEGVSDLTMVFEELDGKLSKLGFERERRRFQPHFTICRVKGGANKQQLVEELTRVKDTVFGDIAVDRVVLKKSVLTPRGPIYSSLAESRHS